MPCCRPTAPHLSLVVVGSFSNSYTLIASGLLGFAFGIGGSRRAIVRARIQPPHAGLAALAATRSAPPVRLQARRAVGDADHADWHDPGDVSRALAPCGVAAHRAEDARPRCGLRSVHGAMLDDDLSKHARRGRLHHRHPGAAGDRRRHRRRHHLRTSERRRDRSLQARRLLARDVRRSARCQRLRPGGCSSASK